MITTASGLQYEDVVVGTGASPTKGKTCVVHYTGWLWVDGAKGAQVDSSRERGQPLRFACDGGQVIKGMDEGLGTMRVGGQRTLTIPAGLGYGDHGAGATIPGGATLRFELELVGVE
ncbi:MAG: FKBP-type peptidyl-prolyl cis-trans isomerase [Myxococcales bacterium]|nr:FKBP-type peptidyl-prolyl cis-trans isomerase [Myxococcales bacterium]